MCVSLYVSVEILQDKWCWKQKKLEVEVLDQDISNLDFIQDGYILQCSLSHLITLVSTSSQGIRHVSCQVV